MTSLHFTAEIFIIGVNPYVLLPGSILNSLFESSKKEKGPIPVEGLLNEHPFKQTLVKYQGAWRLYLNGPMLKATGLTVGDMAEITIKFDPSDRREKMHSILAQKFADDHKAKEAFAKLAPYRQKEILRYLNNLKTEETLVRTIEKVIKHLHGEKVEGLIVLTYIKK